MKIDRQRMNDLANFYRMCAEHSHTKELKKSFGERFEKAKDDLESLGFEYREDSDDNEG